MAKKQNKSSKSEDKNAWIAVAAAGGLGLILGLFALGKRSARAGASGDAGAIDRALGAPSEAAGEGGGESADLALHDRAPDDFRPDMSAGIDPDKRDAFAPATLPNPNAAQPAL